MKNFTLSVVLFLAFALNGFSQQQQNWGGTPPDCQLPAGFTLSQGDRMTQYNNPLNNCALDCGILTPGVGGNNPGNIIFPPQKAPGTTAGTTMTVCFSIFVFDANLDCSSNRDFQCPTYVAAYIVDASYNSVQAPSSSQYYGKSRVQLLKAYGAQNCVSVAFDQAPDPNKQYRIFLDFGFNTTCVQQDTKYIIDLLPSGGPLPLSLGDFLLQRASANVNVAWKTEQEINTNRFEIQRSFDNANFQTVATVAASGNSNVVKSYSFVDKSNTSKDVSFYRLKLVSNTGMVAYSNIKTVKGLLAKTDFTVFPNPSFGSAKVSISDLSEPTNVQVLDNAGRLIKTVNLTNTNSLDINNLQKGAYIIKITGTVSGQSSVRKLTVIN